MAQTDALAPEDARAPPSEAGPPSAASQLSRARAAASWLRIADEFPHPPRGRGNHRLQGCDRKTGSRAHAKATR
jgi:hypothetical protein